MTGRSSLSTRGLIALPVATAVALAGGCAPPTQQPDPPAAQTGTSTATHGPVPVGLLADHVEIDPRALPYAFEGSTAVDPGWQDAPQESAGVFLGRSAANSETGTVRFTAVDATGVILWEAERPSASVAVLSTALDRPIVVLTHEGTAQDQLDAVAYDLKTGDDLWGPVDAPGPHTGPGLVFGPDGARTALDAMSGEVLATDGPDETVVSEHDGSVLTATADELRAVGASGPLWSVARSEIELAGHATVTALRAGSPPVGTALLGRADDPVPGVGILVEVSTGSIVATGVRDARLDDAMGIWVVLGVDALSGHRADGRLWSRPTTPGTTLAGAGGVLAYLRVDDAVHVVNTLTGADAVAYGPPGPLGLAVPSVISRSGAAVVRTDRVLILTTESPPADEPG
ncbi:hypothetical protein [Actinotalea sp. K2]|uniref:hypothetical protein n=1 Tax=Actinotalea sp. K2 TaxID=2939438 RepID=UPI002016EA0A|nr:hypothetical protein [Actinotalea sp. K2]MCL3862274.1 hypothetical protein [Actinotalea sp. K2]